MEKILPPNSKVFEFILLGYYGGTDETDDLVKWVAAETVEQAREVMTQYHNDFIYQGEVEAHFITSGSIDYYQK